MAITLDEFKVGLANKVDQNVIDLVQRNSILMEKLTYVDAVSPGTGGSTLTYGYLQTLTPVAAAGRALNTEYTPTAAKKVQKNVNLQIMGGSFEIDRVLAQNSSAANDEVTYQIEQSTKALTSLFSYNAINASVANGNGYDGLTVLLKGTENEIDASSVDVSGTMTEAKADALLQALDEAIKSLDGEASLILCNKDSLLKIIAAARKAGFHDWSRDDFGRAVDSYGNIPLVDMKEYFNGTTTNKIIPTDADGTTDIYEVRLGVDGLCAVTPQGGIGLNTILPDFKQAGAVHKGEVEIVAAIALKSTKAAAVLRNIKVK